MSKRLKQGLLVYFSFLAGAYVPLALIGGIDPMKWTGGWQALYVFSVLFAMLLSSLDYEQKDNTND